MPFKLGGGGRGGGGGGKGAYKDLERAPLSALDDDDDDDEGMMSLPAYSDNPVKTAAASPVENGRKMGGNGRGGYRDDPIGRKGENGRGGKGARAITIVVDDDDDDDDDDGDGTPRIPRKKAGGGGGGRGYDDEDDDYDDGEEDYFHGVNTPSKDKGRRQTKRRYRGGLACAYLRYWASCRCCFGCCAADPASSSRNIGGPETGEGKGGCASRAFMALFYLFLLSVILLCASAIGYILAQDGSPFGHDAAVSSSSAGGGGGIDGEAAGKRLPPPLANLREICTDWITESGRNKCREECDRAACCSLPSADSFSCWSEQAAECAEYRVACMGMELNVGATVVGTYDSSGAEGPGMGLPSKVELDPPPWNLDDVCSQENLLTHEGFDDCSATCLKSRCCHPEIYGCEVTDREHCPGYEAPCKIVAVSWRGSGHAVGGTSDAADPSSSQQQGAATVANAVVMMCNSANLNPPDSCIDACKPGACCYVSDSYPPIEQLFREHFGDDSPMNDAESCSSNVGFCQQFGSCEHLNRLKDAAGWHGQDVTYELDIASVCKVEYIARNGALECSNVCQPAHCCYSLEYKCDDVQLGHLVCGDYRQCGVLYPSLESTEDQFEMAKAIDEVCSEDSLSLVSGRKMCQKICKDSLCCFDMGAYGCSNDPSKNCLAHAGCETLVSTSSIYVDKEKQPDSTNAETVKTADGVDAEVDAFLTALESACSETSLRTLEGIQQCHNKCQTHLCCFTNDAALAGNDCSDSHVEACSAYHACEQLVTPTAQNPLTSTTAPDLDAIADAIEKSCALPDNPYLVDQGWVEGCHSLCAARLCCLVDAKIGSNCRATVGTKECNAYSACEVLINDSGQEVTGAKQIEDKFGDLSDVCTIAVVQDASLHAACEERCKDRSCCFESTPEFSCYDMEREWCEEFKSCECVDMFFFSDNASPNAEDSGSAPAGDDSLIKDDNDQTSEPTDVILNDETVKSSTAPTIDSGSATTISESDSGNAEVVQSTTVAAEITTVPTVTISEDDDFKSTCTAHTLQQNWDTCKDLCIQYECCFRSEFSCYDIHELVCDDHYICEEFYNKDGSVKSKTAPTNDSGSAATISGLDATLNNNADSAPEIDEFKAGIEAACSSESLKTSEGIEQCYNKCQSHLCCVPTDGLGSDYDCTDTYPDECDAYQACDQLVSRYNIWRPPSTSFDPYAVKKLVNDACIPRDNTPVTREWVSKCHEVCEARMCCLAHPSMASSCVNFLGEGACGDYSACQNLIGGELRDLDSITDLCNNDVSSNKEQFLDCREKCTERACCFEDNPTYSCYETEKEWCNEYESCKLVGFTFLGSDSGNEEVVQITTVATVTMIENVDFDQIESKCSKAYISAFGTEDCKSLCEQVKCCFDFAQCTYANVADCSSVNACNNAYNAV